MAEVIGKLNELQIEEYDANSPDTEITRLRMIQLMNYVYREAYQIGDVVESLLTYDQFRIEMGETWTLMAGQSITQSDLGVEININSLPELVQEQGAIGQARVEGELGLEEKGVNFYHYHKIMKGVNAAGSPVTNDYDVDFNQGADSSADSISTAAHALSDGNYAGSFFDFDIVRQYNHATSTVPTFSRTSATTSNFKGPSYNGNIFIKVNESRVWNDSF